MSRTIVAFHAHPDDEALLTAGTMARLSSEGHRVVLVLATDGGAGLAAAELRTDGRLGRLRLEEASRSAQALGVARVEWLGYADSGSGPQPEPDAPGLVRFSRAPLEEAAERLAAILRTERADLLISYDDNGGYGHRDHVRVHEVGARAAVIAGTPRVLEATVPRDTIVRAIRAVGRVYRFPAEFDPTSFERAFTARADITHRIDVRRHVRAKRESMRAHASQATGGGAASVGEGGQTGDRTLAAFLRIPRPIYDVVFGSSCTPCRRWRKKTALCWRRCQPTGWPCSRRKTPTHRCGAALAGGRRCITFGEGGDVQCTQALWQQGAWSVAMTTPAGAARCRLHIAGRHNVVNAAGRCRLCVGGGRAAGCGGARAGSIQPRQGPLARPANAHAGRDITVVDDTYNANPDSMRAAIDVLADLPAPQLLVMGDMGEVGDQGPRSMQKLVSMRAQRGHCARVHAGRAVGSRCCGLWPGRTTF
jgi:LmbE family N-acetylglucosaminyl deacetylase